MRDPNPNDADAPASSRVESVWFEPPRRLPIGHELEDRRGWRPPSSSHSLVFAGVSFVLVGAAIAGTIFFLTPQLAPEPQVSHRAPVELAPATSASTTSADLPATAAAATPTLAANTPLLATPAPTAIVLGDTDAGAAPPPPGQKVQAASSHPVSRHAHAPAVPARSFPARTPTPTPTPATTRTASPEELFGSPSGLDTSASAARETRDPP